MCVNGICTVVLWLPDLQIIRGVLAALVIYGVIKLVEIIRRVLI